MINKVVFCILCVTVYVWAHVWNPGFDESPLEGAGVYFLTTQWGVAAASARGTCQGQPHISLDGLVCSYHKTTWASQCPLTKVIWAVGGAARGAGREGVVLSPSSSLLGLPG